MSLASGSLIGRYEVVGWLGAGGMGEVYRARDPLLDREVAVKLLPERFALDARRLHRFEQEARAAGRLNHPNLLAVHDIGNHRGAPFIVSELLEGDTLRARLKRGALSPRKAADYARQIAQGLGAAHDSGIVHRDLKPENLFITTDERVKILDFGVAKLTRANDDDPRPGLSTETDPGTVVGTSGYVSPEQVRGGVIDHRSDLFSLGTVLHEMLTGRPAFARATTAEALAAILMEEPVPPLPADVPAALAAIVSRCLEKSRDARFQSARDLAFGLEHLSGSATTRAPQRLRRRRWALVVGSAVVAAVAALAAATWTWRRPPTVETLFANARFTRLTDWAGTEGQAAISPDGRFVAFLADRDGQVDVWLSQVGTGRFQNVTSGTSKLRAPSGVLRLVGFSGDGSEIYSEAGGNGEGGGPTLMPLTGGTPRRFLPPNSTAPSWSPDGARLAFFTNTNGDPLFVADRTAADARQIFLREEAGVHTHNPVWSPDGRWIYFVHGKSAGSSFEMDIWRVRPSGESPEQLTQLKTMLNFLAPIDDRTLLYVARAADGSGPWLWALDIPSRGTRRLVSGLDQYRSVSASRDGRRLVATIASPTATLSQVRLLDRIAEERDIEPYPLPVGRAHAPRFGRRSLFYLSGHGADDGLWRSRDGQPVEIWKASDGPVAQPAAVAPDESRLAVVLRRGGKAQLATMSADGTDVRTLASSLVPEGTGDWSPDGAWVVIGGTDAGSPGLYKIPAGGGKPVKLVDGQAVNPIWSADGRLIVYNGPIVAGLSMLLGVRPDGVAVPMSPVKVRPGGQRFLPNGKGVVYQSAMLDFHLLDLASGSTRQLTQFKFTTPLMSGRSFDVTPDGSAIVFDRSSENSDIVLIELPR